MTLIRISAVVCEVVSIAEALDGAAVVVVVVVVAVLVLVGLLPPPLPLLVPEGPPSLDMEVKAGRFCVLLLPLPPSGVVVLVMGFFASRF